MSLESTVDVMETPETAALDSLVVRPGDLAVLGEFSGIPGYILQPTFADGVLSVSGGLQLPSLDRVRARSFKVSAYSWLLLRRIQQDLVPELRLVYSAGGRFLLVGPARGTAEPILSSFQRNLDEWALRQLRGEMQLYLVAARCDGQVLPVAALEDKLALRRHRPLEGALLQGAYWNPGAFWNGSSASGHHRCAACGATDTLHGDCCLGCLEDQELGRALPPARFGRLVAESAGQVSIPGLGLTLGESGDLDLSQGEWPLLRHVSVNQLDRDKLFACLAVDVDYAARAITQFNGDAQATAEFSRGLQEFFSEHARRLIEARFSGLYPVYGGGDELLAVGPWNRVLEFVIQLRRDFEVHTERQMSFSAGLAMVHPQAQLRASASEARELLMLAKRNTPERNGLAVFGKVISWEQANTLADRTHQISRWLRDGLLNGSVLRRITELHRLSTASQNGWRVRYLPMLASEARKVTNQEVRDWLHRLGGSAEWRCVDLLAEMALLTSAEKS